MIIIILQIKIQGLFTRKQHKMNLFNKFTNKIGQSIFEKLVKDYGQKFMKLIVADKSKQIIEEKFGQLYMKGDEIFSTIQQKINFFIGEKLQLLTEQFQKLMTKIDQKIPHVIETIEKMNGQSIYQLSGVNALIAKVNQIKEESIQKCKNKKTQVYYELDFQKYSMLFKIESQIPKIPIYDSLPKDTKVKILHKAQNQLSQYFIQNRQEILKLLTQSYIPESYRQLDNLLNELNIENIVNGLTANSNSALLQNIISCSKKIGVLIQNIF